MKFGPITIGGGKGKEQALPAAEIGKSATLESVWNWVNYLTTLEELVTSGAYKNPVRRNGLELLGNPAENAAALKTSWEFAVTQAEVEIAILERRGGVDVSGAKAQIQEFKRKISTRPLVGAIVSILHRDGA